LAVEISDILLSEIHKICRRSGVIVKYIPLFYTEQLAVEVSDVLLVKFIKFAEGLV
jgi:hypothetical protein